jgi:hypothetical protein
MYPVVALVKLAVVAVVALGALATAVAAGRRRSAIRARMRAAPKQIEDNAVVTLTGTVKVIGEPLVAPLSGTPCVAYRASARSFSGRTVDQQHVEIAMTPFLLVTSSGEILIDGDRCELPMRPGPIIPRKIEREQGFLNRNGITADAKSAGFDEVAIAPAMRVSVYGIARTEVSQGTGETSFREAPRLVRLSGDEAHPLTIDLP